MTNRPGATASAQRGKLWWWYRMNAQAAIVPVMIPPGTPRPVKPLNAYEPSAWTVSGRIAVIGWSL